MNKTKTKEVSKRLQKLCKAMEDTGKLQGFIAPRLTKGHEPINEPEDIFHLKRRFVIVTPLL